MVVLKKIKAASLVESLTASVIIVVVFMIASLSFNNVFMNAVKSNDNLLKNRIKEISYFARNKQLNFPFYEEAEYWVIWGERRKDVLFFEVENKRKQKSTNILIPLD